MQDSPAVALLLTNELQALLKGRVRDRVDVVGEESADKEGATLFEMLNIGGEVGDDDVAMDVGNDEVELSFDGRGIAVDDLDIRDVVQLAVLTSVGYTELVDIDSGDCFCFC